jgi:hypothetical protein
MSDRPPRVIILSERLLTDKELERAFVVSEDNMLWRAVLQLIGKLEEEARATGDASVGNPPLASNYHGGAQHLAYLRDMMFQLRQQEIDRQKKQ